MSLESWAELGQSLGVFRPKPRSGVRWAASVTLVAMLGGVGVPVLSGTAKPGSPLRIALISAAAFPAFLLFWVAITRPLGAVVCEQGIRNTGIWKWKASVRWSEIASVSWDRGQFLPLLRIERKNGRGLLVAGSVAEDPEFVRLTRQLAGDQNTLSRALGGKT